MTEQRELFVKSDIPCNCKKIDHAVTEYEFREAIFFLKKLKGLILTHGWDLSDNYYHHYFKINQGCNAWDSDNVEYLVFRSSFHKDMKTIEIPLKRVNY